MNTGRRPQIRHRPAADACRNKPRRWHRVRPCLTDGAAYAVVSDIRNGVLSAYKPRGSFEAEVRRTSDGIATVWARYIG